MKDRNKRFPILRKELHIDENKEREYKEFEKRIFLLMTAVYCRDCHTAKENKVSVADLDFSADIQNRFLNKKRISNYKLCPECYELIKNAFRHTEKCPHSYYKTFCHECPTPCYRKEEQAKMLPIMHYSGKRIIKEHPIYALRFASNLIKNKILIREYTKSYGGSA
jgi:hypothetical protein